VLTGGMDQAASCLARSGSVNLNDWISLFVLII